MHNGNGRTQINGIDGALRTERGGNVAILGGGVAGLASGLELARRGWRVTVLERASEVGGLARTVEHGQFRFDIGGHRFHSHSPRLLRWIRDLLGDDLLEVERRSHIYLHGRYVTYPLQFPGALRIFNLQQLLGVLSSYGAARWRHRRNRKKAESFESWVVQGFGRELFEIYFRPYTEKVWGMKCDELSADWAAQRITVPDLAATIRHALIAGRRPPPTLISSFYYPRYGFGMIPARIFEALQKAGGNVLTRATVRALQPGQQGYTVVYEIEGRTERLEAGQIISTIPLDALLQALPDDSTGPVDVALDYRDLICVFLAIDEPRVSSDHWTYFPQPELIFGRTHEPGNWSEAMAPPGMTSLVAEIFSSRDEETWRATDDVLVRQTVTQLASLGLLSASAVVDSRVLRVKNAYPVYRTGYATRLEEAQRYIRQFPGLHLAGRTGAFRYMNSDGVLEDALSLVDWLCGQSSQRRNVHERHVAR